MIARSIFIIFLIVGLSFSTVIADSHEKGEGYEMEMGAPEQMEELAFLEGEWDVDMQWRDMENPEKWNQTENWATYNYILEGSAMESHFKGEMSGMPFEGYMLMSYDRHTNQWQNMWIDSMGGKMSFYTGNEKDGKMILTGEETWGNQTFQSRTVISNQTENRFEWSMDHSYDGGETWQTVGKAVYTKREG